MPEKPQDKPQAQAQAQGKDVLVLGGPTEDGAGVNVLRARQERVEIGTLHPLKHGQAIHGEVVKLTPRAEGPRVFDVEIQVPAMTAASPSARSANGEAAEQRAAGDGPAKVATEAYRKNWDTIWRRPTRGARKLAN